MTKRRLQRETFRPKISRTMKLAGVFAVTALLSVSGFKIYELVVHLQSEAAHVEMLNAPAAYQSLQHHAAPAAKDQQGCPYADGVHAKAPPPCDPSDPLCAG